MHGQRYPEHSSTTSPGVRIFCQVRLPPILCRLHGGCAILLTGEELPRDLEMVSDLVIIAIMCNEAKEST